LEISLSRFTQFNKSFIYGNDLSHKTHELSG
jgi:hypothetical protein